MSNAEEIIKTALEKIAANENMQSHKVIIEKVSAEGTNFMSDIYRASITSPNRSDLSLFAKLGTLPDKYRKGMEERIVMSFKKEAMFYSVMAPAFEELQEKNNIPMEDRYKLPKYYHGDLEGGKEIVVLEDLTAHGYSTYGRMDSLDWESVSGVVEELAKFHALTIAYKHEYPESYASNFKLEEYVASLEKGYAGVKGFLMPMAENGQSIIPEELQGRLQKFMEEHWKKEAFIKYHGPSKHGFIIHNNCRTSNIMYKRCDGDKLVHVIIDYQTIHLGSPSIDLLYLIYLSTDQEFRRQHLKPLLDHYYGTFSKFLRQLSLDPDQIYSRDDFDEEYKDMSAYGLCISAAVLPTVLAEHNHDVNMARDGKSAFAKVHPSEAFKERFLPILNEYIERSYL